MFMRESAEMYLETILILSRKKPTVRSIDIAEEMGFSKPSVSRAVGKLKEQKHILVGSDGAIALTDTGRAIAETIYERHTLVTELLIRLGVDGETAAADACRIEHVISAATFDAIKRHVSEHS